MIDVPSWAWGVLYAGGAAATGAWFLREWARNETLQDRIAELGDILVPLLGPAIFRGLMLISFMVGWPAIVVMAFVWDVPGHGRNVDKPEDGNR
jgi:hypothetical protein